MHGKGTDFVQLSGFGIPDSKVYADPVTMAFHPDLYTSDNDLRAIQEYADEITSEYRAAIQSDVLPEKVRNMLSRTLLEDNSNLPASVQLSKERNRDFVRRIFELHQSGIGPRNSPEMMNLLHNVYATEAFRFDRHERFLPVMPNTMRFTLASETLESMLDSPSSRKVSYDTRERLTRNVGGKLESTDVLKFRLSGHKMLFGAGDIPEFFSALGGFDLDDKGLFKLETFTDASGERKLMFAISRQPSGIQEAIYARANLGDAETVKGLLGGNERMMKRLKDLASSSVSPLIKDPALIRAGERRIQAAKDLMRIVNDEAIIFSEGQVERNIMSVYEAFNTSIKEMDAVTVGNMFEYGASALRKITDGDPIYRSEQVIKLLQEKGAFGFGDMGDEALKVLDQYAPSLGGIADDLRTALESGSTSDLIKIFTDNKDSPAMRAFQDHTIFRKMLSSAAGDGNFLGVYVNRSMVVGSTMQQLLDTMTKFDATARDTDEIKKLMSYKIGLLDSETAIDATINFGLGKFETKMAGKIQDLGAVATALNITGVDITDEVAAQKAIMEKLGYAIDPVTGKAMSTLDEVGEISMEQLGKVMGGVAAAVRSDKYQTIRALLDKEIGLGIDEILLEDRISNPDLTRLIKGIRLGFQEVKEAGGLVGAQLEAFEKQLIQLEGMKEGYEGQRKIIMDLFGLNAQHKYASLAKIDERTARVAAEFRMLSRLYLSNLGADAALSATEVSQEARRAAEFIIDRNKAEFADIVSNSIEELSGTSKALLTEKKFNLGQKVEKELQAASSQLRRFNGRINKCC